MKYLMETFVVLCVAAIASQRLTAADSSAWPNIVFIMADDLGWTDLGCMGTRYYQTPNIDRLAKQGMTFTSYYVCQNCAPTRAALMSGQYAPRTGIYTVGSFKRGDDKDRRMVPPENNTRLPLEKLTIAELLDDAGYVNGMFGKWHLGNEPKYHPSARGFHEAMVTSGKHFDFRTNPEVDVEPGKYLADFLTDRAVDFIQRHRDEAFFLYLPHFAVHTPVQAKKELIGKYKNKSPVGGHDDPVYAAMIHSVDESVGRIEAKLAELGLAENTVLIFTSDNGGLGGYEVPGTEETKGITDNSPLRGGKGMLYEGGVRVPLIIRWPHGIQPGTTCDEPIAHVDFLPTFAELSDASIPADYLLDGVSLTALFRSPKEPLHREALYWHFPGYLQAYIKEAIWRTTPVSTIRAGDWKLMEFLEDGHLELYNLAEDLGEQQNLAQVMPEQTQKLQKKLAAWRTNIGAAMPRMKTATELATPEE